MIPALYANAWALNDITEGVNPNCGQKGFEAGKGWVSSTFAVARQCEINGIIGSKHRTGNAELSKVVGSFHAFAVTDAEQRDFGQVEENKTDW